MIGDSMQFFSFHGVKWHYMKVLVSSKMLIKLLAFDSNKKHGRGYPLLTQYKHEDEFDTKDYLLVETFFVGI